MMRTAVLQMQARAGAVSANLERIEEALAQAAASGADLLVAPELAVQGYGAGEAFAQLAEPRDGTSLTRLQGTVERTGVALVVGFAERGADRALYNSAAALRAGEAPVVYRKAQLYESYERTHFAPGKIEATTFRLGSMTVGMLICFDVEFPEHVRRLALAGADVIAVPTALPDLPSSVFVAERIVPVRAFENQLFIAYADLVGHDGQMSYAGRSVIVAPDGEDLARASADEVRLLVADLGTEAYSESRALNPYLAELRV